MIGRIAMVAVCSGILSAPAVVAQDAPPQGRGGGPGGRMNEERQLDMLTKHLSLTTDQQTQVKAILDDQGKQMGALRNDTTVSGDDKRAKMMSIRKSSQDKIRATLTDDQKTKYDAMLAEMQERMKERGGGPGGPPPSQ
jgi:Spy/CpxP family protein refolding chaperone